MTVHNTTYGTEKCEETIENGEFPVRKRNASIWSCDFESAIEAAGFGKFNAFLAVVAIFTGLITVLEPRSNAYIVPAAQCDLHLNLHQKAMLNSVPLIGMVLTSFLWGFMGDSLGRKKLILLICFLDFACWILAASAQSFPVFIVARLLGGMVSSGIYPILVSYLSEIHGAKHRAIVQLFMGNIFGLGDFILPLMALMVLTTNESYHLGSLDIYPWNIYLLICAAAPLLSCIGFFLLPESPKFLISKSQNEKALNALQSIYNINIYNSKKEDYPVKSLKRKPEIIEEINSEDLIEQPSKRCLAQMVPFLERKNLKNILLSVFAQCFIIMGFNSILLWLPQIFQEMINHQRSHNGTASFCETLNDLQFKTNKITDICEEDMSQNTNTYFYCMIVASATIVLFAISGFAINTLGKKRLLYILGIFSAIATLSLVLADSIAITLILTSVICAFGNIGFNALVAIVVDIFPTNLRAMAVALTMMIGRLGGAVASFIFPIFLPYSCTDALTFIAVVSLAGVVTVYLLPDIETQVETKGTGQ